MSSIRDDAFWEHYTPYPLDRRVVPLHTRLQFGQQVLRQGKPVFELSFSRRIHHFEANPDAFSKWFERLADDIVAGAHEGERTPSALVYYGPASIGSFWWGEQGFSVSGGAPLPGDLLKHPVDGQPLSDNPSNPRFAVTAAIHTLDLLERTGYELPE